MATRTFFTRPRRDFIARAMMDIVKLLAVAAFASGFFLTYEMRTRIAAFIGLMSGFWISVAILPGK